MKRLRLGYPKTASLVIQGIHQSLLSLTQNSKSVEKLLCSLQSSDFSTNMSLTWTLLQVQFPSHESSLTMAKRVCATNPTISILFYSRFIQHLDFVPIVQTASVVSSRQIRKSESSSANSSVTFTSSLTSLVAPKFTKAFFQLAWAVVAFPSPPVSKL